MKCSRLSCVGFVVVFGVRVRCRLPVLVCFFVFGFTCVFVYMSVCEVGAVLWFWVGMFGRCLLGSGSISVVFGVRVLSGVDLLRGRLRDVVGGGA